MGGPVEGNVTVDVQRSDTFDSIFTVLEKAVGKGSLWGTHQLHPAVLVVENNLRRVRPLPHVIQPTDTPGSLRINGDSTDGYVMIRLLGSAPPEPIVADSDGLIVSATESPPKSPLVSSPAEKSETSFRRRLVAMYGKYAPEHLVKVDAAIAMFAKSEEEVMKELSTHYGPEPNNEEAMLLITTYPNAGASYFERLTAIYTKYHPDKLETIPGTLKKFAGREEDAIRQLVRKYGPEPALPPLEVRTGAVPSSGNGIRNSEDNNAWSSAVLSPTVSSPTIPNQPPAQNPNPGYSYRDRFIAIYTKYEPGKLRVVDNTLKKFVGQEEVVIRQLVNRYGEEPVIGKDVFLPEATNAEDPHSTKVVSPMLTQGSPDIPELGSPGPTLTTEEATAKADYYRERVTALIEAHEPDKLGIVDRMLLQFQGREEEVLTRLQRKYRTSTTTSSSTVPNDSAAKKNGAALATVSERKHVRWHSLSPVIMHENTEAHQEEVVAEASPPSQSSAVSTAEPQPTKEVSYHTATAEVLMPEEALATSSEPPLVIARNAPANPRHDCLVDAFPTQQERESIAPAPIVRHYAALAQWYAARGAEDCVRSLRQRYFGKWNTVYRQSHAIKVANTASPNQTVKEGTAPPPAFTVGLADSLRSLVIALKKCFNARVVEVSTDEEEELARSFLAQWSTPPDLAQIEDSTKLTRAVHQAAHLLSQLETLVTIKRTQDSQLQRAKVLLEQLQVRKDEFDTLSLHYHETKVHLEQSRSREKQLAAALVAQKKLAATTARGAIPMRFPATVTKDPAAATSVRKPPVPIQTPSARQRSVSLPKSSRKEETSRTVSEMEKEVQIVHLQQELARARARVERSKETEKQLQQKLSGEDHKPGRLQCESGLRSSSSATPRSVAVVSKGSSGTGCQEMSSPRSNHVRRSMFSDFAAAWSSHNTPQQAKSSPTRKRTSPSSVRQQVFEDTVTTTNRRPHSCPWPRSRAVPDVVDVDHGSCPNCRTHLTSISTDAYGPPQERAAFCFSCRRSFTFEELLRSINHSSHASVH